MVKSSVLRGKTMRGMRCRLVLGCKLTVFAGVKSVGVKYFGTDNLHDVSFHNIATTTPESALLHYRVRLFSKEQSTWIPIVSNFNDD